MNNWAKKREYFDGALTINPRQTAFAVGYTLFGALIVTIPGTILFALAWVIVGFCLCIVMLAFCMALTGKTLVVKPKPDCEPSGTAKD